MFLKILHLLNTLLPSGAESMLRSAAPLWTRAGLRCEILATGPAAGPFAPALESAGFPIHHIPFAKSPSFFRAFYRLLRSGNYDALHIHAERGNFPAALCARFAGVPRILRTVHAVFPFTGPLAVRRRAERALLRHSCSVTHIAISPSVVQNERDRFGNPATLIPNWYDASHFLPPRPRQRAAARAALNLSPSSFAIATVGNCSPVKNHPALLHALSRLRHLDFVYLHVGHAPDSAERELAASLGLADRVRFLGSLPDPLEVLHAADAFVMPSTCEGFGLAAVEAMAAGLPVLLADSPGLADFRSLSPHLLFANPDPDSLAAALGHLAWLPPSTRTSLGLVLHDAVSSRFSPAQGAQAYLDLYRSASHAAEGPASTASSETSRAA